MQFDERRLPNLTELDAVDRPVYIQAAQGGTSTNTEGKAWLEARGVTVGGRRHDRRARRGTGAADPAQEAADSGDAASGRHSTRLQYYARLGITTHRDSGAFHADDPATGIASENTYTMHDAVPRAQPRGASCRRGCASTSSTRIRQTPNPPLPTLSQRLRNSFPFFGNDWLRTGGIGEFTGGGWRACGRLRGPGGAARITR